MKTVLIITGALAALVLALGVHIYWVTRPPADGHTRVMARIDLHQKIGKAEADSITAWLYRQKGVDHVLVNPRSAIAVFTFSPLVTDGNRIVESFRAGMRYSRAVRYVPSAAEIRRGCPMTATPVTSKIYNFFKRFF